MRADSGEPRRPCREFGLYFAYCEKLLEGSRQRAFCSLCFLLTEKAVLVRAAQNSPSAEYTSKHQVLRHLEGRPTFMGLTHCSFIFRK